MEKALVDSFCLVLSDFLGDMYKSYPDNSLLLLKKATDVMIYTSPKNVVDNFMLCVSEYSDKILNRDSSFFMDGGLESELSTGEYSFLLDELKKISSIWKDPSTSLNTKNCIWKYLETLVTLGKRIEKLNG